MSDPAPLVGAPITPLPTAPRALTGAARGNDGITPEIRKAAEDFESMFIAEMLQPMFENLDTEGLGGGGAGEQAFRPMLVEQYAQSIAKAGGIGLADNVMRELARLQSSIQPDAQASTTTTNDTEAAHGPAG